MIIDEQDYLSHYGVLRRSGRYPWGSGGPKTNTGASGFLGMVKELKAQGMKEVDIAKGMGISTTELRAANSIAKNEVKQADIAQAQRLRDKGMSKSEIGRVMGKNESSIRALLQPGAKDKADVLTATSDMLRQQVINKGLIDVGKGVHHQVGISANTLNNAVAVLKEEGYVVHTIGVEQLGTGQKTNVKVLAPPETKWGEVNQRQSEIQQIAATSKDSGRTFLGLHPPLSLDPKRVAVRYKEDGGSEADGVLYVRPGVKDVQIGASSYAQVRVTVGGTHFLKGMAVYKDDLPAGVDVQFNTNKSSTGNKLDAMKPLKTKYEGGPIDHDNPYGANIKPGGQIVEKNAKTGKEKVTSVMNIVNEREDWSKWSRTLSSQMLSKQSPTLAKTQLDLTLKQRQDEFERISALTNPSVRRKLLTEFGDGTTSASVHLKAAAIPRTFGHHVIMPVKSMKPTEVYAPNYRDGETVVLIRHPHGGTFEIPQLKVNNKQREAIKLLGKDAPDAIGIHHSVAERLSGADFDGDTVLVIPNNGGRVKTTAALEKLKNFDPQREYPKYPGMKVMSASEKQNQMGKISNLITDMTIKGANTEELARAVRHSMVVIDAEKHKLNYKLSAEHNGIAALKEKYQGGAKKGASTLISRATSEERVPERKPRRASQGGSIDKATGKRVFEETGAGYNRPSDGKWIGRTSKVEKLANTDDARTLSSGTRIESIYADHSNKLKKLGDQARKIAINTPPSKYDPSARKVYAEEVNLLAAKLRNAERNAPLERQAQIMGNMIYQKKLKENPNMEDDSKKKIRFQALAEARLRMGAGKEKIFITAKEWEAIQAGAVSPSRLDNILEHADMEQVRKLATPKPARLMSPANRARAQQLLNGGYTRSQVADRLGVSLSTLDAATSAPPDLDD